MTTETKTVYTAYDGTIFDNMESCLEYEKDLVLFFDKDFNKLVAGTFKHKLDICTYVLVFSEEAWAAFNEHCQTFNYCQLPDTKKKANLYVWEVKSCGRWKISGGDE